jgi:hypothetical protein
MQTEQQLHERKARAWLKITPLKAGLVTGAWAAIAVGVLAMTTPEVFGICGVSHPRDLIDWIVNSLFGTNLLLSQYSVALPVLTYVGIVIGSFLSSLQSREFNLRSVGSKTSPVVYGFAVGNFGMLMGYCSVRAIMLLAYGNLLAIPGLAGIILGVVVACRYVKWRVKARE